MSLEDKIWADILKRIEKRKCTPIIGDEVCSPWINYRKIATRWAKTHTYPFEDPYQLSRIAQFLEIDKIDVYVGESFPKRELSEEIEKIAESGKLPDFSTIEHKNTPYSILADLNLDIYITTNYDLLMEAALKAKGKSPVSELCRWNRNLSSSLEDAGIRSVFEKGKYIPTSHSPLVYHLYGMYRVDPKYRPGETIDDQTIPQSLVLTERDLIDFALTLNKERDRIFPAPIRKALEGTSLLFIGYTLDDLSFRVIFQGVVSSESALRGQSVCVQVQPRVYKQDLEIKATKYLEKYTRSMFKVHAYWGDPYKFCEELQERWNTFKKEQHYV